MPEIDQTAHRVLIEDLLRQKKSETRWKNFRFVCWFGLIVFLIFGAFSKRELDKKPAQNKPYAALVRLNGTIAPGNEFSAETAIPLLKEAFQDQRARGVIIVIDSEGGTPVQAALIHDAIIRLKKQYKKKVIVIGEDILTSGAYYVAVAGDKIYVNPNTLTGSIGVIMKGFGYVKLMEKLGVERRIYIAGDNKDRLDPFLPQNNEDRKKVSEVMDDVHLNFMNAVIKGRGKRINKENAHLFSGDFWSGTQAVKLGLVDGLGDLDSVLNAEFQCKDAYLYETPGVGLMKYLSGSMRSSIDRALMWML